MHIYFSDKMVAMRGYMNILAEIVAETGTREGAPSAGMGKAIGLHAARKLPKQNEGFLMEWGF